MLFVVANTPSTQPCSAGGTARIFTLDPITGQAPTFSVFDANRDSSINSSDAGANVRQVAGGILSLPKILGKQGSTGVTLEAATSRGQTGANLGGVEANKTVPCTGGGTGTLVAGVSDTSTTSESVKTCDGKARVTWRQIR